MKKARCRKWLAVVLSLALALSMLPGAAFAEEVEPPAEETLSCQLTEGCTLEQGHEGECVVEEPEEEPADVPEEQPGEIPAESGGEDSGTQPTQPENSLTPEEPTAVEQIQERIDALPDVAALEAMTEDGRNAVYNEMLDIYDAIDAMAEGKDQLDIAGLEAAAEWFNGQTEQVTDDGVNTAEEFAAALTAGGEVTLTGSFEISEKMDIVVTRPVTLNLNGNTVTKSYSELNHYFIVIKDGGSLTIDGANGGKLEAAGSRGYGIQLQSGGTLIVNSGTLEANQEVIDIDDGSSNIKVEINGGVIKNTASDSAINIREGAVVDITGGEIIAPSSNALFVNSYGVTPQINISGGTLTGGQWTVYVSQGADVTVSGNASLTTTGNTGAIHLDGSSYYPSTLLIEGGEIQGDYVAVDAEGYSKITMTGGSITTNRSAAMELSENATADISDGALTTTASSAALNVNGTDARAAISGGTFTSGKASQTALSGSEEQITVTGGTFSTDVEEYVYDGLTLVDNDDGTFTVDQMEEVWLNGTSGDDTNTGADQDKAVKTLEHALNLVADDGVIYICGQVTVDSALTVEGATIERANGFTGTLIRVTGTGTELTLVNATIDGKKTGSRTGELVDVTAGATLSVEEGTKLIDNNETAIQVEANSTLDMNGGEISGNAASTWGGGIVNDGGIVNLNGGFITRNTSGGVGGGVVTVNGGTTTLNGATISDNTAAHNGGGVYVQGSNAGKETVFEMKDGAITANAATGGFGGGIYALYHTGKITVRISGGSITDNVMRRSGAAVGLEGEYGNYPSIELSGTPNIEGDVFLYDREEGPVIHITGAFAPAEPIVLSVNRGAAGTVAVSYAEGIEPDAGQFVSESETIGLKQDGQNLVWAKMLKISFKSEDNKTTYQTVYVLPDTTIDAGLAPMLTQTGYTLAGWHRLGVEEAWDFTTDIATKNMTLQAIWNLNAPDVNVIVDDANPHIGTEAVLTASISHELSDLTYTYQWYKDGEALDGETNSTLTVSVAGSYTVEVIASDGAKQSAAVESEALEITIEDHIFGEWTTVSSPTCTDAGSAQRVCQVCNFTETDQLDPLGHEWEDGFTVDQAPTCTAGGSQSIHCKHCDAVKDSTVIPATGHSFGDDWKSDAARHWHACTVCGAVQDLQAHTFAWVTDQEASASENGSRHEQCTVCGYAKPAETIPATGTNQPGDTSDATNESTSPKTADDALPFLAASLLMAACAGLAGVLVYSRKKKRNG